MIWIDFTFLGLFFIFFVIGLLRGFIKEVFSLAFWILAVWVSLNFTREFSYFLESSISHPSARMIASFMALFAITLCFGGLIGFLLNILVKNTGLTIMDRFGGMIFGVIRGMVVVTVVVILAGLTPLTNDSWWTESIMIPPFQSFAVWLRDHISSGVAEYIRYR
ncbi:CvpA family protein [Methylobacter sp.]|uniref:CvpA family protein n=1 Tax=Methylobacter sp. TaxID=2051955 RepID=UPI001203DF29|nr:CvpA family protein [Methylobacter sp.]TAK61848.1 MAG: CvpA family protein [Methylobacter sp.]